MNTTIHHSTIKMWPFNVNSSAFINFGIRTMKKILNLKLVVMKEYQNIRTFLQKVTL